MDGTTGRTRRYTGRMGIPPFREVAKIAVLRIPANDSRAATNWVTDEAHRKRDASPNFHPVESLQAAETRAERSRRFRSEMMSPDGSRLQAIRTPAALKRLIANDGSEMIAAHLSCIGYRNHAAAALSCFTPRGERPPSVDSRRCSPPFHCKRGETRAVLAA